MRASRRPALGRARSVALGSILTVALWGCTERVSGPSIDAPPDIFLIVVDSLRPDHLASYGYQRATDPALQRLGADAVLFEQAFTACSRTIPAIPQLLSSYAFPDSIRPKTLMDAAQAAGYSNSLAVISQPAVARWVGRLTPSFAAVHSGERSATEIVDTTIEWIEGNDDAPGLAYLHFVDSAPPYQVPEPYHSKFVDEGYVGSLGDRFEDVAGARSGRYRSSDRRHIVDLYDGTIAYIDTELGRLFDKLKELGRYTDALIIVTSGHGTEFWDHGSFLHGHSLYDELLRVPLIVKYPGAWRAGSRSPALASTLDILPSVAELMTAATSGSVADPQWQGRLLSDVLEPQPQTPPRTLFATVGRADRRRPARHSVRSSRHKFIVNIADGTREFYELDKDALERRSVVAIGKEPPRDLVDQLQAETAVLHDVGYQLELSNPGDSKVSYDVELAFPAGAPIANLHRIDLEKTDSAMFESNASALQWKGRLTAGETDRIRFDLLGRSGALRITLTIDGHIASSNAIRIGSRSKSARANPATIDLTSIDAARSTAAAARAALIALIAGQDDGPPALLRVWRSGESQALLSTELSEAEQARIEALGDTK